MGFLGVQKGETMMKRIMCGIFLILYITSLGACAGQDAVLRINPEIELYTPTMSSTPGIGLIAAYDRDLKNSDYKFHWVADEGTFLRWNKEGSGRIEELGNDVYTNEHKVYWTIRLDKMTEEREFYVHLSVVKLDDQEVIDQTDLLIRQDEVGMFQVVEE